jgi:tetratricopeptide (TPR) repeat protein
MIKENNIPIILGTVASNLKDQPPFISVKVERYPSAEELFRNAENLLTQGINIEAAEEFRKAKDLDVLRFRAPEEINIKIKKLCKEFSITIVDIDSVFNALSPHGITGSNLMTDHLHPTLEGYQLIGRLYYDQMEKLNLLPKTNKTIDNNLVQDSLTRAKFSFSKLDSVIAVFEIKALKNDWPFTGKNKSRPLNLLFERNNILDSTAADVITGRLTWEDAQKKIAEWYLLHKDISSFKKQMDVLISQFPFTLELYDLTVGRLLKLKEYDGAYEFLSRRYKIEPNGSAAKWLGIYDLTRGNTDKAIQYLEESLRFNQNEPLVLYNLSCAYSSKKEYDKALSKINLCLSYNPDCKEAKIMQSQLISLIK